MKDTFEIISIFLAK